MRFAGEPRTEAQRILKTFLETRSFEVWPRDTVLARGDTVYGPVLALEGSVRIGGRIEGDIYVVDGDLFLRPGSAVGGVVVLGGGFYDSRLAEVGGPVTYRPNEALRVRPADAGFEVFSETEPDPPFELAGLYGVRLPAYERVSGLTLRAGALGRLAEASGRPELSAGLSFLPARKEFDFALRNSWHIGDRLELDLFLTQAVASNEEWITPEFNNSMSVIMAGRDRRNYYQSERFGIGIEWRSPPPPVWRDMQGWSLGLSAGREKAASLAARAVTVVFGEISPGSSPEDLNPPVDDGTLWFVRAGFVWSAESRRGHMGIGAGLEAGFEDDIAGNAGDARFDFLLAEARLSARRVTPWGHRVGFFLIARRDLAGQLPRQRYSAVGGYGTIPTLPLRELYGRRLLFADAEYAVPIIGTARLGGLDIFVRGSVGGADQFAFNPHASVAAGVALRLLDFQINFGVVKGATASEEESGVGLLFEVSRPRPVRPTQMKRG